MVKFVIEVINVSAPKYTKTANGGYNAIEVAFKRDGKVDGKKLVDFNGKDNPYGKSVYDFFVALKGGENVEVEAQKGEKFWNWIGVTPVGKAEQSSSPANAPQSDTEQPSGDSGNKPRGRPVGSTRGRVTGSNYETPAERAKRQVYIVRQSSITAAIELLKSQGAPFDTGNVIEKARQFEEFVFEPKADLEKPGKFDDMEDDIPF